MTTFKFKIGDHVKVVDDSFLGDAKGYVVNWWSDQGNYEIWVPITPHHMKSIFVPEGKLEKVPRMPRLRSIR